MHLGLIEETNCDVMTAQISELFARRRLYRRCIYYDKAKNYKTHHFNHYKFSLLALIRTFRKRPQPASPPAALQKCPAHSSAPSARSSALHSGGDTLRKRLLPQMPRRQYSPASSQLAYRTSETTLVHF